MLEREEVGNVRGTSLEPLVDVENLPAAPADVKLSVCYPGCYVDRKEVRRQATTLK